MSNLFPKQPRRMLQPTKDQLRDYLAEVTAENLSLRAENEQLRRHWWPRLFRRNKK